MGEALRSMPALVTQVNPSSVLVRMENGEVGLQILEEDTMMTKEPRDWATIDRSIGIGDKVTVHALLMDPSKRAPYLCTAVGGVARLSLRFIGKSSCKEPLTCIIHLPWQCLSSCRRKMERMRRQWKQMPLTRAPIWLRTMTSLLTTTSWQMRTLLMTMILQQMRTARSICLSPSSNSGQG